MKFRQIEQPSMITELTHQLLQYLLSGDLKPGDRLPSERQLSEAMGMGRSTLREALKALTVLGLLDVRQGDGTFLRKADSALLPRVIEWGLLLGEKQTLDLVEARQHIETLTAGLSADCRSNEDIEELRRLLGNMERAQSIAKEFAEADVAFHLKLAEASGNSVFHTILCNLQALLQIWIVRVIEAAGPEDTSYQEHVPIFQAVERGDAPGAAASMRAHMDAAAARLMRLATRDGAVPAVSAVEIEVER